MIGSVFEERDALAAIDARRAAIAKTAAEARGATESPMSGPDPGTIEADDSERGYIQAGHAAASPQHGPPNSSPLVHGPQGHLTPVEMSAEASVVGHPGPLIDAMASHQARATLRPPIPQARP